MTVSLTLTETQTFVALRQWLLSVLPAGTVVVQGQANRAAPPTGVFVVITPVSRTRLETNLTGYDTTGLTRTDAMGTQVVIQCDIYAPEAADLIQTVTTLFRSDAACDWFTATGLPIQPLFAGEARQMAFVNDSNQYENRWSVDLTMQVNPTVVTTQDFATSLVAGLIDVDATYPPGAP